MATAGARRQLLERLKKSRFTPAAFRRDGLSILGRSKISKQKKAAVRRLLDSLSGEECFNVGWAVEMAGKKGVLTEGEVSRLMREIYGSQWERQRELQRKVFGRK